MGERRLGNYSSCCRLCLSEKLGTLKSIFDDDAPSRDIVKNIQDCIDIEIQVNDKLSTMICEQCLSKVNGWSEFRRICNENQEKLMHWMNNWTSSNIANMSIQIKDEVVEDGNERPTVQISGDDDDVVQVKSEPVGNTFDQEEDIYDLPPPLTPYPPDNQDIDNDNNDLNDPIVTPAPLTDANSEASMVNGEKISETSQSNDAKNCRICNKVFSSVGNRRKHENMIHRRKEKDKENNDQNKQTEISKPKTSSGSDGELQKIQFAAGLKLKQRSETTKEVPIENMPLTKVEISYLEKCKVIVKMADTLTCSCHQDKFGDVKDLFNHLKKQRTWFAMFTCYNCLITFGDRSSYMKHYYDCPKQLLQNLRRLSESPVNPEIKIRLYQSYRCIRCNCIFSFHEDFCSHFDQEHMEMPQSEPPYVCLCSKTFDEVDNYKQHLHISCFLRYFCDICFGVFPSTDAFKLHCVNEHDAADGSTLESYDTFHKGRTIQEMHSGAGSSKRSLPAEFKSISNGDKRRRTINLPVLEPADPDFVPEQNKVINPHAIRNTKSIDPQPCPFKNCGKWYSSYHNMLRHYKQAHDKSGKILQCSVCPMRFCITSALRKHESAEHNLENPETTNTNRDEFKFSCPECGDLFKSLDEWKRHMEKHPKKACFECGKQFTLQSELEQHRSTHLNIKVYRDAKTHNYKSTMVNSSLACEICDKNFDSKSELRQHKLLHEKMPVLSAHEDAEDERKGKERSKKYSCHTCNKHYVSYGGIWDHNKKHHSGQNIVYPRRCNQCTKLLTSKGAWSNHQKMHERYLQAQQEKAPVPKSSEVQHRSKHRVVKSNNDDDDEESYHTCKRCFKVFSNKYSLKNHMKSHGITVNANRSSTKTGKIIKTYWCDICHQACQGYAELQQHKKEEHHIEAIPKLANQVESAEQKKPLTFSCNKCSQTFHTNFAMKRHMEKHAEPDVKPKALIYCKHCKIPFYNVESLNKHMTAEHDQPAQSGKNVIADKPKKFPCNVCKKVFDNTSALCSHLGWHKRGKFGKKVLKSQEKMVRSMLNQMPHEQPQTKVQANYQCYTCSKTFINETALQIHILEYHRNVNTTVLSCNSCKLSFETRASFDTHMQLHKVMENQTNNQKSKPAVNKPHKCKFCPSGFSRSDTLNAHVRQHHKEHYSDYYKCTQCDRVFDKQNALTIHLKVHDRQKVTTAEVPKSTASGKNVYFCSICDVGFALAKDLRNHVVTEHPF